MSSRCLYAVQLPIFPILLPSFLNLDFVPFHFVAFTFQSSAILSPSLQLSEMSCRFFLFVGVDGSRRVIRFLNKLDLERFLSIL